MKKFDLHNDPKIGTGFKVPDNYFENFETRIMSQIPAVEPKVVSLWQRKSLWITGVAAVFAISFGTWMYFNQQQSEFMSTSQEYLAYQSDITTDDIAGHLTDDDIANLEKNLGLYGNESATYVNEYLN